MNDYLPTEPGFYEEKFDWLWKCSQCSFEHVSKRMSHDDVDEEMKVKVQCPGCSVILPRPTRVA